MISTAGPVVQPIAFSYFLWISFGPPCLSCRLAPPVGCFFLFPFVINLEIVQPAALSGLWQGHVGTGQYFLVGGLLVWAGDLRLACSPWLACVECTLSSLAPSLGGGCDCPEPTADELCAVLLRTHTHRTMSVRHTRQTSRERPAWATSSICACDFRHLLRNSRNGIPAS